MKKWKTKSGYEIVRLLSGRSNVFFLTNGNKNVLIDTSVSRNWTMLQQQLDKSGINTLDYLILTHAHFDHAANANRLKEKFNCKVYIQSQEERYLEKGENIIPEGTNFMTRLLVNLIGKRFFQKVRYEPCKPDVVVNSAYPLEELGFNAYLMHTPGHTSGSMSLIIDNEIAIVGDTMFGVFKGSVFPPYAQDKDTMVKSWGKLLETGCSEFLPSHGTANKRLLVQKDYNKRIKRIQF